MASDKRKILSGFFWKFGERMASQGVSFVLSIILARLLMPSEYGVIAMVNIFIIFANVFITSGFTSSLIQKKDADDIDFSTILYCSIGTSIIIYVIMYLSAPYIAAFYDMPELCKVTRVYSIVLILSSYNSVQNAYVSRHMMFKKNFFATMCSTILSAIVGIFLAYQGFGVWALVAQHISNTIFHILVLRFIITWRPTLTFSYVRAKSLMSYGSKVLASDLVNTFVKEIRQLLIGKYYSPADLALYNRGNQLPNLVATNLDTTLRSVLFPAMSNHSDNVERVKQLMRRSIRTSSYLTFFFMSLLAVVSEPLIRVLLTDKWIECVPYMQIICISRAIATVSSTNMQALKAIGKSDEVLKMEAIKKPAFLLLVFVAAKISVFAVAMTMPLYSIYALVVNMSPSKKYFKYGHKDQVYDLLPATLMSIAVIILTYPMTLLECNDFIVMALQIIIAIATYILLSVLFKVETYYYLKDTALNLLRQVCKKYTK